jgi:hypothetical protein
MSENESSATPKPKRKRRKPVWVLPEDQWQFAKQLMAELGETEQKPRHQIARIIRICSVEFAEHIFQQVVEVENNDGMLTADGSRRRTPGGVFFYLARQQMNGQQRRKVFPPRNQRKKKRKQTASSPTASEPEPPTPQQVLPPEAEAKLTKLQLAAEQFRRKIEAIEAEPDQQFMLALTRKLLRNTENQIAELMQQYSE